MSIREASLLFKNEETLRIFIDRRAISLQTRRYYVSDDKVRFSENALRDSA
jgi:hypothetical protein